MRWLSFGAGRPDKARPARKRTAAKGRTKSRRGAPKRRPMTWAEIARGSRLVAGLLALIALTGGGLWVWDSGIIGRQIEATGAALERIAARGGLVVRSVTVEGRARTNPTRLLAALGTARGEPILRFDPHAARARVEALPWVATARVERRLPDSIHVVLSEREPLALWQRVPGADYAIIDRTGAVVEVDTRPFADLPVIVGADAPPAVPELMRLLALEPALADRVRAATWVDGRRWTLHLDDVATGIDVRLPEDDPAAALARLAELERDDRLLARDIDRVDLRLPDRLVVRPRAVPGTSGEDPAKPVAPTGARRVLVSTPGQDT